MVVLGIEFCSADVKQTCALQSCESIAKRGDSMDSEVRAGISFGLKRIEQCAALQNVDPKRKS